jgi:hypothetical protein
VGSLADSESVLRKLTARWGVLPILLPLAENPEDNMQQTFECAPLEHSCNRAVVSAASALMQSGHGSVWTVSTGCSVFLFTCSVLHHAGQLRTRRFCKVATWWWLCQTSCPLEILFAPCSCGTSCEAPSGVSSKELWVHLRAHRQHG